MHAQPPRTLKRLLKQYGQELIDDPRRTEALLRDHCGQHTREIFVLVNAQKQRVPNELLAAPAWMPRQATYTRLSKQLQTKLALTEDAANWAVAAWAAALDLEAMPKGDNWSWLPNQLRGTSPPAKSKSRSKKRQNSASSVQSSKVTGSKSARQAKARSERAELGWGLPAWRFPPLPQFIKRPIIWSNLLPWVALLTATIFLLAVVYVTGGRNTALSPTQADGGVTAVAESPVAEEASAPAATSAIVTPLPDLPAPAIEYLLKVMALPTWANVNAEEPLLVRPEPTTAQPYLGVLQDGTPVSVIAYSEDGRWSQITSPYAGWVNNQFLSFFNEDAAHSAIRLNVQPRRTQPYEVSVRAEPDTNSEIVATLSPDKFVVVAAELEEPGTWLQIADPVVGWVAANDLAPASP